MATTTPIHPRSSTRTYLTVDISTGATGVSDVVNLTGLTLSAIATSTAWTDARIGFRASVQNSTTMQDVYDTSGNFLTYATSANRTIIFDPLLFVGIQTLQVVSETSAGTAVAQAATRTLTLGLAKLDAG